MYPIDTRAETYGRTEEIIGNWMATRGTRGKVVVATKIVGPNAQRFPYIRGGETRFDRKHIEAAVEASLKRLKTERSEEHTSELQSLMRISSAVFCLKKKTQGR